MMLNYNVNSSIFKTIPISLVARMQLKDLPEGSMFEWMLSLELSLEGNSERELLELYGVGA
jgi:hypothetical protein